MPKRSPEELSALLQRESFNKNERKAQLCADVAMATELISDTLLGGLCNLFITDFVDVIRQHPGFALEDKRRSLQTTLTLFEKSRADVIAALDDFDTFRKSGCFHWRAKRVQRVAIETSIRKEIYCFASLAHSLEDHCRQITKHDWSPPDLLTCREKYFGVDGFHDFVCGLRVALHHRNMVEAEWLIKGSGEEATGHYTFDKRELLSVSNSWRLAGIAYLESADKTIDVRHLINEYSPRVLAFYKWFFSEFESQQFWAVKDFRRCWSQKMSLSAAQEWRLLLTMLLSAKAPIDPYKYLDQYLTKDEIDDAMRYPIHSKEQVDYIISVLDERNACTDEIREMAYKLFKCEP